MTALIITGLVLFGLVIGSFLNVVVYRIPAGMSVVSPPSACPQCGKHIRPRDNVPVFGWLILGGKCRDCAHPISIRYPLVEAGTALLFVATYLVVGLTWVLPAYLWFVAVTFVLSLIDFDTKRIPDKILLPGTLVAAILLGVGALAEGDLAAFGRGMLAGGAFFGGFLVLALIVPSGFGGGDVKLAFILGLFAGYVSWRAMVVSIFLAVFIGGGVSILLLVGRRVGRKEYVPFGPSLVLGSWLGAAFGDAIASWYLG
ncbi:MAG: prepilin peptidase [Acidimicrobiia bacterium]|nr:prepilin peptidase [Acidimicrobiia bacterium]